jgi:hypothetical protein
MKTLRTWSLTYPYFADGYEISPGTERESCLKPMWSRGRSLQWATVLTPDPPRTRLLLKPELRANVCGQPVRLYAFDDGRRSFGGV